jgi:putative endonuclease
MLLIGPGGMMTWKVYMIRCRDNSLYTGITTDVERRFIDHKQGRGAKSLRGKGPLNLVFSAKIGPRSRALKLEYRIKQLSKEQKERIVSSQRLPVLRRGKKRKGKRQPGASLQPQPVTRKSRSPRR